MFLIEGLVSVVLGVVVYGRLDSRVEGAEWLSEQERTELAAAVVAGTAQRDKTRTTGRISRWKLLADPAGRRSGYGDPGRRPRVTAPATAASRSPVRQPR
jgi:hypothetical protein